MVPFSTFLSFISILLDLFWTNRGNALIIWTRRCVNEYLPTYLKGLWAYVGCGSVGCVSLQNIHFSFSPIFMLFCMCSLLSFSITTAIIFIPLFLFLLCFFFFPLRLLLFDYVLHFLFFCMLRRIAASFLALASCGWLFAYFSLAAVFCGGFLIVLGGKTNTLLWEQLFDVKNRMGRVSELLVIYVSALCFCICLETASGSPETARVAFECCWTIDVGWLSSVVVCAARKCCQQWFMARLQLLYVWGLASLIREHYSRYWTFRRFDH